MLPKSWLMEQQLSWNKIEKIKEFVIRECDDFDYRYHLLPVVQYAQKLAETCNANKEVVELSAWLHDIGRIKFGPENHEVTGAKEAEKILKQFGYSEEIIAQVRHCILCHRGSGSICPQTIEAEVLTTADAMAHLELFPALLAAAEKSGEVINDKICRWIYEKIERDWNKKMLIPEAKEAAKEKYEAIKLALKSRMGNSSNQGQRPI